MMLPTPGNPQNAPEWENYIVAQTVQAMLGIIPSGALAVGVEVGQLDVCLWMQLTGVSDGDLADMEDIQNGLQDLIGESFTVKLRYEIVSQRAISPVDGVRWVFLARANHTHGAQ